jgi:hypothetical protein
LSDFLKESPNLNGQAEITSCLRALEAAHKKGLKLSLPSREERKERLRKSHTNSYPKRKKLHGNPSQQALHLL